MVSVNPVLQVLTAQTLSLVLELQSYVRNVQLAFTAQAMLLRVHRAHLAQRAVLGHRTAMIPILAPGICLLIMLNAQQAAICSFPRKT